MNDAINNGKLALPDTHKLRVALDGMTASQHMQAHVHATGGIWPVGDQIIAVFVAAGYPPLSHEESSAAVAYWGPTGAGRR